MALLLTLLRFGPRLDDTARDMGHSDQSTSQYSASGTLGIQNIKLPSEEIADPELQPLRRMDPTMSTSFRQRASLGGIL